MAVRQPAITGQEKRALVRRHLRGQSFLELSESTGLTLPQIRKFFKRRDVLDLILLEKGCFSPSQKRAQLGLALLQEKAVSVQEELLSSTSDEIRFKASKFILETLLPREVHTRSQVDMVHHLDANVVVQATETMDRVLEMLREKSQAGVDRYTLRGMEGIEMVEPAQLPEPTPTPEITEDEDDGGAAARH